MPKEHTAVCLLASKGRASSDDFTCLCSLDRVAGKLEEDDFAFAAEMQQETDSATTAEDDEDDYDYFQDDLNFDAARERGYR